MGSEGEKGVAVDVAQHTAGQRWSAYRNLDLFRGVSLEAVERLLEHCFEAVYREGEVILQAGEENRCIYLVLRGRLRVHLGGLEHPPLVELGPGSCAGEMSILSQLDVSAHVVAAEDCRLLVVDQELLWSMINASHGVARNMLYILSGRVRDTNDRFMETLESRRRYEQYASVDALTGLHNRRWLDEMLAREVERCHADGLPMSLLMLDVDHFKRFNDSHGHLAGDDALRTLAQVLRRHLRPVDMAARFGGEEFVVLLHGVDQDGARRVAERLRADVAAAAVIPSSGDVALTITASFGVAALAPGMAASELLAAADGALYRAKDGGRDRVAV